MVGGHVHEVNLRCFASKVMKVAWRCKGGEHKPPVLPSLPWGLPAVAVAPADMPPLLPRPAVCPVPLALALSAGCWPSYCEVL